jgi:hypothetical protein
MKAPRFVLLIEVPENVLQELRVQKLSPQTRAHAVKAAEHERLVDPVFRVILLSNTPREVKNPGSLGDPAYVAEDGCRAWVIRTPGVHSGFRPFGLRPHASGGTRQRL